VFDTEPPPAIRCLPTDPCPPSFAVDDHEPIPLVRVSAHGRAAFLREDVLGAIATLRSLVVVKGYRDDELALNLIEAELRRAL
jgi:hypothetical protein